MPEPGDVHALGAGLVRGADDGDGHRRAPRLGVLPEAPQHVALARRHGRGAAVGVVERPGTVRRRLPHPCQPSPARPAAHRGVDPLARSGERPEGGRRRRRRSRVGSAWSSVDCHPAPSPCADAGPAGRTRPAAPRRRRRAPRTGARRCPPRGATARPAGSRTPGPPSPRGSRPRARPRAGTACPPATPVAPPGGGRSARRPARCRGARPAGSPRPASRGARCTPPAVAVRLVPDDVRHVLLEHPARGDGHDLHAPADAEHRQVPLRPRRGPGRAPTRRGRGAAAATSGVAPRRSGRPHVGPAGDDEPVEPVEHGPPCRRRRRGAAAGRRRPRRRARGGRRSGAAARRCAAAPTASGRRPRRRPRPR